MIEMIKIEGGAFEHKGSAKGVSDFSIGKYPVTQKQWKEVMGNNPSYFQGCDDCPVENVSWYDVQDFIAALNQQTGLQYRLPTETEWEYAARGGNQSVGGRYAGGNDLHEVAWFSANSGGKTQPVGLKKPNVLGLHYMSGNVSEWCQDWYAEEYYTDFSVTGLVQDSKGPDNGTDRVVRGGSWACNPQYCRVADRNWDYPDRRYDDVGFRLAHS
jgi:formylglycine-generating enzyme required for sulfatase activity